MRIRNILERVLHEDSELTAVVINSIGAKNNFVFSVKLLLMISYKYLVPQQYLC